MATCVIGVPGKDNLSDRQFVDVPGPDGTSTRYQFDEETCTLIRTTSDVIIPSFHGHTHVSTDPVPEATPWLKGLMSAEDKAKLDSLTQTRLGVLGFLGAGFPDDGGWMQGDIILAAGSEFIQLERVGNIIRFTVDSPIPLNCNCEECAQIFWIQDESDVRSVRPPSCSGVMPGTNVYGEMKVFLYPENSIFNPNEPNDFFDSKGQRPSIIFKRYDNSTEPDVANYEMVLKRRNDLTNNVGWAMTPGATGVAESIWYMGDDQTGRQITFELNPETQSGLLGSLLYNKVSITKQPAIIVNYTDFIVTTNQYVVKKWSVTEKEAIGDDLIATNTWKYTNVQSDPRLVVDATIQLIDIGEIVDLIQVQIDEINGQPIFEHYFSQKPSLNPSHLWTTSGYVKWGDTNEQRDNINNDGTSDNKTAVIGGVSDERLFEKDEWGLTGFPDDVLLPDDGEIDSSDPGKLEPSGVPINEKVRAFVDTSIPGLVVRETKIENLRADIVDNEGAYAPPGDGVVDDNDLQAMLRSIGSEQCCSPRCDENPTAEPCWHENADINKDGVVDVRDLGILGTEYNIVAEKPSDLPVFLWHKQNHNNVLIKFKVGRPCAAGETLDDCDPQCCSSYPPVDLLFGAPIDNVDTKYVKIIKRGVYETPPVHENAWVLVEGANYHDIPSSGTLRIMNGVYRDVFWKYHRKYIDGNRTILASDEGAIFPFDDDFVSDPTVGLGESPTNTTICSVVHEDYTTRAMRFEFSVNPTGGQESVKLQITGGILSMATSYELDIDEIDGDEYANDDFVRGFLPGSFVVSDILTQYGFTETGDGVTAEPTNFRVVDGGFIGNSIDERWNEVCVMVRDDQVWVWWNDMLISPSTEASAALPTPMTVNTPYWPISTVFGKVGFRLWPKAIMRDVQVCDQIKLFNEFR